MKTPRTINPAKSIGVQVDATARARAENVWRKHNEMAPVPATKSAIYKAAMDQGLRFFEEKLGLLPAGA